MAQHVGLREVEIVAAGVHVRHLLAVQADIRRAGPLDYLREGLYELRLVAGLEEEDAGDAEV